MKKIKIIMILLLVSGAFGIFGNNYAKRKHSEIYVNYEALTSAESGNQWESNYQYCRCKDLDDDKIKTCVAGNAISLKPACKKEEIGAPLYCRDWDANCQ